MRCPRRWREKCGPSKQRFDAHNLMIPLQPARHRIIGFRNILIHGYDTVDDAIVWGAVKDRLPVLIVEIRGLLRT